MKYRLKNGVVLFPVCGEYFIVPSRKAALPPVILSAAPELVSALTEGKDSAEEISSETRTKLQSLTAAGIVEEY